MNTIGSALRLTIFGESHGEHVGALLDGLPAGMEIDVASIQRELDMRRPAPLIGTARHEADIVRVESGVRDGRLTGTPLVFLFDNTDVKSATYKDMGHIPRPGHADYTSFVKYGGHADYRGGGQFSGRLTAPLVAAGAAARQYLARRGVKIAARVVSVHSVTDTGKYTIDQIDARRFGNELRCIDEVAATEMRKTILDARKRGDSVGGVVECIAAGVPAGLGEPFFDTVEGEISKMMFSIPAVKAVEFGSGFRSAAMFGSENNDPFRLSGPGGNCVVTETNNAGGVNGGITNGMDLWFRLAIKPASSISIKQRSVDLSEMKETEVTVRGRHDPCIVPRAVIVVEAACALVLADLHLRSGLK